MKMQSVLRPESSFGEKFITLPDERLVFLQRKHFITLLLPSLTVIFIGILISSIVFAFLLFLKVSIFVFLLSFLTIFVLGLTSVTKLTIDWLFNFYVVTNRKIIEIKYAPLFLRETNKILLDQVRCTEIDAKTSGIINEIFDIGDIIITFDRPTHKEELILESVKDPRRVEAHLESALIAQSTRHATPATWLPENEIWIKERNGDKWVYSQEIPIRALEVN